MRTPRPLLLHGAFSTASGQRASCWRSAASSFTSMASPVSSIASLVASMVSPTSSIVLLVFSIASSVALIESSIVLLIRRYCVLSQVILWPSCDGSAPELPSVPRPLAECEDSPRVAAAGDTRPRPIPTDQPPPPDEPIGATWAYRQIILVARRGPNGVHFPRPHVADRSTRRSPPPPIAQGENRGRHVAAVPPVAT